MSSFKTLIKTSFGLLGATVALLAFVSTPAIAQFGVQRFAISARNEDGTPDVQAGSHPYALTTTLVLNQVPCAQEGGKIKCVPEGNLKDVRLELPPGLVGDPNATPRCTYTEFANRGACSNETVVGAALVYVGAGLGKNREGGVQEYAAKSNPVFNLVPPRGVAAEFGFTAEHVPVLLQTSVRTGGDYGLTTSASDIAQPVWTLASKVTIWGVPAISAHNNIRGSCLVQGTKEGEHEGLPDALEAPGWGLREGEDELEGPIGPYAEGEGAPLESFGECPSQAAQIPLLDNPTSCGVSRTATLSVDSWKEPGVFHSKSVSLPELSGCEKLDFSPTIDVFPNGTSASTPTGLSVALRVPQESTENPVGLAEADARDTTVALPAGMELSPSAANGLEACSLLHGTSGEAAEEGREVSGINLESGQPADCPEASRIASVRVRTPLIGEELSGAMYLAAPQNFAGLPENPFSSLLAVYLVIEDPERGIVVKLAGRVTADENTGQLTTTFEDTPQLPFSELEARFARPEAFGGEEVSPLATPALCASYTTTASLAPWSGTPAATPSSSFPITSGPAGGPCTSPGQALPFNPTLHTGSSNVNAGAFSPLSASLSREDGQQSIRSVVLHYPPGLAAILAGVALCGEAQANAGTCGAESLIGEATASVGLGSEPYTITGGKVYLTERYEGAPFGLSIVTPAKAGPFVLQKGVPVVVRARLEIDPRSAAVTVTTGSVPQMIEGIPLQIKHVNVLVNRPGFTFNPASCEPVSVTGSVAGWEGATIPVSTPFHLANCASLKFQPSIGVTTKGKASKADGASLSFKIGYPKGPLGTEAWFEEAKFTLPIQLPARLTTIQKACLAATFEANPESCPGPSKIGTAVVRTQVLPVPLQGPIYFVSYGGQKFPEAVIVLKGYGITIDLHGETFIAKNGLTSATFKNTPDVPFENIEVTVPQGPYSEFAANVPAKDRYNLCGQTLTMPTLFKASNGAEINQNVRIAVTGCPNHKHKHTKRKRHRSKHTKRHRG